MEDPQLGQNINGRSSMEIKNGRKTKTLRLNTTTLRQLTRDELDEAAGGTSPACILSVMGSILISASATATDASHPEAPNDSAP
jgi:hypothetical protein